MFSRPSDSPILSNIYKGDFNNLSQTSAAISSALIDFIHHRMPDLIFSDKKVSSLINDIVPSDLLSDSYYIAFQDLNQLC